MEFASTPGLIGAAVGLGLGYLDFRFLTVAVEGRLRKLDRSATAAERADFERRVKWMRAIFFALTMLLFPVIGYVIGRRLGE